jgi:hypothetical protein
MLEITEVILEIVSPYPKTPHIINMHAITISPMCLEGTTLSPYPIVKSVCIKKYTDRKKKRFRGQSRQPDSTPVLTVSQKRGLI